MEIAKCLLQRLRMHLVQPRGSGLLLQACQFGTQRTGTERLAGLLKVFALTIQPPIPDKAPCACKLIEHRCLRGGRLKPIAIGCLNRSHGESIADHMCECKSFYGTRKPDATTHQLLAPPIWDGNFIFAARFTSPARRKPAALL